MATFTNHNCGFQVLLGVMRAIVRMERRWRLLFCVIKMIRYVSTGHGFFGVCKKNVKKCENGVM
jgi:hypothetical protein